MSGLGRRTTVVALTGATGAGKDTLANQLVKFGYHRFAFGDVLRKIVKDKYGPCEDERLNDYLNGKSFKDAMLSEGRLISFKDPAYLSDALCSDLSEFTQQWAGSVKPVVITDLRKPLEIDSLCRVPNLNLYFLEVMRPGNPHDAKRLDNLLSGLIETNNAKERSNVLKPKALIVNSGSPEFMLSQVADVLELCLPYRTGFL